MFKKFLSLSLLALAFTFAANTLQAQLNFFNGSPCAITVKAAAENNAFPCQLPTCASAVVNVPPGGFVVIPFPACFTTAAGLGYRAVKFSMVGGIGGAADKCTGPNPFLFLDCQGNPRQLRITAPNFAGIF